jgi:hypothetical protein
MNETVDLVFGEKAIKQMKDDVPGYLLAIANQIDDLSKKTVSGSALSEITKATNALKDAQVSLANVYQNVAKSQVEAAKNEATLARAARETAKADLDAAKAADVRAKTTERGNKEATKSTAQLAKEEKELARINKELTNDYLILSKAYNEGALRAKNYTLQLGANHPITIQAVQDAKLLSDQLKKIDASVGQNQRNVGNYSGALSGLQFSLRNIASELPNIGISLRTFAQSISNNLTPFVDNIKAINAENKILRAEGKPTISVIKQIGQSFFSIGTLVSLAIIVGLKFIEYLDKQKNAANSAEKANKKYADSLNSIEESSRNAAQQDIARITVLTKLAADENQTHRTRMRSIKELQETYPATFGALSQQAILEGKLGDAVNKTTEALIQRATYQAAEKKFAAAAERVYDLTLAQRQATEELAKAEAERRKADADTDKDVERRGLRQFAAIEKTGKATKQLADINKDMVSAMKERDQFLTDAQVAAAKAGDVLFGKDPKEPKGRVKAYKDENNEIVAARKRLSDAERDAEVARLQDIIETNKSIFENERAGTEARTAAYAEMYVARLQLADANREKELHDIITWEEAYAGEIEKALATDAKNRTEHQQALLIDAEYYATLRIGVENRYNKEVNKINTEALSFAQKTAQQIAKFQEGIGEQGAKDAERFGKQIEEINDKYRKRKQKKDADAAKLERQRIIETIGATQDLLNGLYEASKFVSDKKLEQYDIDSKKNEENLQQQIDGINAEAITEEEKEEKIKIAKGRTEAAQKQIDEDRRRAQISQAKREKEITIANIILTTALAVVTALKEGDPYTKTLRAIAAGVIGAAQLAVAVATPIPQYAEGTDNHPGGWFVGGDGGEPEWVKEPGKRGYFTPATDTLLYGARGTTVTPFSEIANASILDGMSTFNGGMSMQKNAELEKELRAVNGNLEHLTHVVKHKKENHINITEAGLRWGAKQHNAWTDYMNRKVHT